MFVEKDVTMTLLAQSTIAITNGTFAVLGASPRLSLGNRTRSLQMAGAAGGGSRIEDIIIIQCKLYFMIFLVVLLCLKFCKDDIRLD